MINKQKQLNYEIFGHKKNLNGNINQIKMFNAINAWKQITNGNNHSNHIFAKNNSCVRKQYLININYKYNILKEMKMS